MASLETNLTPEASLNVRYKALIESQEKVIAAYKAETAHLQTLLELQNRALNASEATVASLTKLLSGKGLLI